MDKVPASTASTAAQVAANKAAVASVKDQNAGPDNKAKVRQDRAPAVSITEVAADAADGKLRSVSALASISESIDDAVEVLNEALSKRHTSAQIRRDDQLNRFLVTIKDKDSGEVVREIPAEALLKFARNLEELKGILFDETL